MTIIIDSHPIGSAPHARGWTLAYRRSAKSPNFRRPLDWAGTWEEAARMVERVRAARPDVDVRLVPSASMEAWEAKQVAAGRIDPEALAAHGIVVTERRSGRRGKHAPTMSIPVRVRDAGSLRDLLSAEELPAPTRESVLSLAGHAARCDRSGLAELRRLAEAAGYRVTQQNHIRRGDAEPLCKGWQTFALRVQLDFRVRDSLLGIS